MPLYQDLNPKIMESAQGETTPNLWVKWLKKFGALGFLFFLIKGLVWLTIIFGAGKLFK